MMIDIKAIVDTKINDMQESGAIKAAIEKGVETTILKAIDEALGGYQLRNKIEKNISESVSDIVENVGFSA